ncbi:MAG: transcription termination/antitermination factor NusG [Candidatus Harrisonbacteria bacterium CG10_big_fil_rev_8_21_14_0_10_44_23]|uniref:Transcription termination/antitermination protein NusG n=1 Tax=Candidatus Harrisonbacteria bacterium CG10_big_fil_rev_8_21_14_0_10_44_23 TaxID=1974585 RepID=A0A2H0UQH2_9BACT|nr:MAG: transcription termination/antitermination factor NusG [Candidatus Harrisonbacteria bacterium CG10_big_fil_rev_8_21_14_0_10_44_23]
MNEPEKKDTKQSGQHSGERHWYAVHTYSGYEDAVARYLTQRVGSLEMSGKIFSIVVPKEKKIRIKNGRRKEIEEKIYPGYVLVDMVLTDDTWYVVRNTPRVTGFVGSDTTTPLPLSQKEVDELMKKMGKDESYAVDLAVGDMVKIVDGPFKDYEAKISQVDEKSGMIKVAVPIFGRDTTVELDSLQVQKI